MITYYCYMGSQFSGRKIVDILFGDFKVISFFEEKLDARNYSTSIDKILVRIFVDGNISQYPEVKEDKIHYSKKFKCLSSDFHLTQEMDDSMDMHDAFNYIKICTPVFRTGTPTFQ